MAQYPAVIELSDLDGTNGFEIFGKNTYDLSGSSVASAGDVNGDGFDDVIIGAVRPSGHGRSGESYVVFGKASGFSADLSLLALDGMNGFQINGDAGRDRAGVSVASAGDVNGDGFADLIIGAPGADPHGSSSGASYVVFGKPDGFPTEFKLRGIDGTNGFKISGENTYDFSGLSVASAGDVNGDGFADLIIGADGADPHGARSGASYVVFGKAGGFAANLDLSSLDGTTGFQISGVAAYDYTGFSVASAGDVNGDGFDDLIIGAPDDTFFHGNGADSYVVFGKASGFAANFELSSLDGTNGFKLTAATPSDHSGRSVASAGDINADGFADIIVGALGNSSDASYVVFGKAGGFAADLDLGNLDGTNGFRISGGGTSVASAGDVNGDGFDDIIVGRPGAYGPNGGPGASYVIFGKASGFAANFDLSSLDGGNGFQINGEAAGDRSGGPVASAGDVNADGFADLIIGATGAGNAGASYVVFGAKPGEAVVRNGTDIAQTIRGGDFDDRLSGRGGDDTLVGYAGNDAIKGGTGNDAACGGDGNDSLRGDAGNDTLKGNAGDDILTGGKGFDRLTGGADSDTFVFKSAAEIGLSAGARDAIVDFVHRTDHIDLSAIDANSGAAGDQAFSFIGTADFSGTAGELRYARTDAGVTLIAGDINGDGVTDFRLELSGLLALNADDFVL